MSESSELSDKNSDKIIEFDINGNIVQKNKKYDCP